MTSSDDRDNYVLLDIPGRVGTQLERLLRAFGYVLHCWCDGHLNMKEGAPEEGPHLKAIAFDKLVAVVARIWNAAYYETSGPALPLDFSRQASAPSTEATRDEGGMPFPCPFQELPGKHGPGRALCDGNQPPLFVGELFFHLQRKNVLHYVLVTPPKRGENERDAELDPSDPETIFEPGEPITDPATFLDDFDPWGRKIVYNLSNGFRLLTEEEVRALGTHRTKRQTLEDIWREFSYLKEKRVFARLKSELTAARVDVHASRQFDSFADEAVRKSSGNRETYRAALEKLLRGVADPEVKNIVRRVQRAPEEIWDEEADRAARWARKAAALARFLLTLGELQVAEKRTQEAVAAFTEVARRAQRAGFDRLPARIERAVDATSGFIVNDVAAALIEYLDEFDRMVVERPGRT